MEEANRVFLNGDWEEEANREQKKARKARRIERQTQALAQQQAKILALIQPATMRESQKSKEEKRILKLHQGGAAPSVPTAERMGIGKGSAYIALKGRQYGDPYTCFLCPPVPPGRPGLMMPSGSRNPLEW